VKIFLKKKKRAAFSSYFFVYPLALRQVLAAKTGIGGKTIRRRTRRQWILFSVYVGTS